MTDDLTPDPTTVVGWETDDADAVVWGTHDPTVAETAFRKYLVEIGGDDSDEYDVTAEQWAAAAKWWARPDAQDAEYWTEDMWSRRTVDGWVPYMMVTR